MLLSAAIMCLETTWHPEGWRSREYVAPYQVPTGGLVQLDNLVSGGENDENLLGHCEKQTPTTLGQNVYGKLEQVDCGVLQGAR